ncbi:MAG: hypothetical protein ACO3PD_06450 [Acidimicrobiales bacterium]|jgi:hypothetical protein
MMSITEQTWMEIQMLVGHLNRRTGRMLGDRGEGVISTAIAVLITSFIGAAMWVAFDRIWGNAESNIEGEVNRIGAMGG